MVDDSIPGASLTALLIISAGKWHVPLLERARELGLDVVATHPDGSPALASTSPGTPIVWMPPSGAAGRIPPGDRLE